MAGAAPNLGGAGSDTGGIDTENPTVLNVVVGDPLIADDDAGDAFMVTFSGAMNQAVTPTLTFAPALTSTLTGGSGSWTDATTYVTTYTVADRNVYHDSVTADVTGAQDLAGNAQQDYTPEHEVEVDTLNSAATVEITAIADDTGTSGDFTPNAGRRWRVPAGSDDARGQGSVLPVKWRW